MTYTVFAIKEAPQNFLRSLAMDIAIQVSEASELNSSAAAKRTEALLDSQVSTANSSVDRVSESSEKEDAGSQFLAVHHEQGFTSALPSILTDHLVMEQDAAERPFNLIPRCWRDVRAILHHNNFHYLVIALVFLYLAVAFADILVALYIQCKPNAEGYCSPSLNGSDPSVVTGGTFLYSTSLAIISFFVVEISLSILAFGYKYFFDVIRVIDMIVIFGTFVMEIYFKVRHFGEDTIKLIIILHLWKIIRAMHAISHVMEIKADKRINSLKRLNKTIQNEFIRLESSSHVSRKKLRSLIESHAVYDNLLSASYQSKNKFLDSLEVILNEMDYARIREQRGIANAVNDIAGSVLIDGSVLMIDDEKNSKLLKLPIESINDN